MCGLVGFIEFQDPYATPEDLLHMREMVNHRGPDDRGYFFERGVGLAHTRLAIIDLSQKAHQPMRKDNLIIVYNGEIYNFKELRNELLALGCRFQSNSDTEVVLEAYRVWGREALSRFNGMFVFVVYDSREKSLFLARDRGGIKPLVYYYDGSRLVFGSEIKAICMYPYLHKKLSRQGLIDYLRLGYISGDKTIWEDCFRLLPGQYMKVDIKDRMLKTELFFEPFFTSELENDYDTIVEQLKKVLIHDFDLSMVSDVAIGACISGGVDSNVLVSILAKELGYKLRTFSLGSEHAQFDENSQAEKVAKYIGLSHRSLMLHPESCREFLLDTIHHFDEPAADQNILSLRYVAREAKKEKISVLLSGMGGDELFLGYPTALMRARIRWFYKIPLKLRRMIPRMLFQFSSKLFKGVHLLQQNNYFTAVADFMGNCFFNDEINQLLMSEAKEISPQNCIESIMRSNFPPGSHTLEKIMKCDLAVYLVNNGLHISDICCMAEGVEMRLPYLNNNILEFALKTPSHAKCHQGIFKSLLRSIETQYLPKDVTMKGKRGFYPFIKKSWLENDFRGLVDHFLSKERIIKQGIFNHDVIRNLLTMQKRSRVNVSNKIWNMLVFQIWAEEHL